MYVARCDMDILRTEEMYQMKLEYQKRFGEIFIPFNYGNFHRMGEKCAAQVYKETLQKALEDNKPCTIAYLGDSEFDN